MTHEQFVADAFTRTKLRRTPVRAGVLEVLFKASAPLGAVEILEKLPPHTDAVTVYRTLNTFVKQRIFHRIRGEDGIWRYAVEDPQQSQIHRHPHFVCDDCGRVECLKSAEVPDTLSKIPGLGKRYTIQYAEVVLHGSCPKCRA